MCVCLRKKEIETVSLSVGLSECGCVHMGVCLLVCVCVCVCSHLCGCERKIERERDKKRETEDLNKER